MRVLLFKGIKSTALEWEGMGRNGTRLVLFLKKVEIFLLQMYFINCSCLFTKLDIHILEFWTKIFVIYKFQIRSPTFVVLNNLRFGVQSSLYHIQLTFFSDFFWLSCYPSVILAYPILLPIIILIQFIHGNFLWCKKTCRIIKNIKNAYSSNPIVTSLFMLIDF